ncbi:OmpA family protein [Escherichia coli]
MFRRTVLTLLSLSLLSGCGNLSKVSDDGRSEKPVWPPIEKSTFNHNGSQFGSWPNWDNVYMIKKGMNKDQIYNLIGRPHFSEGVAGVREWDYVFNFENNSGHHICQFKVLFDKNMNVGAVYWLPDNCKLPPHSAPAHSAPAHSAPAHSVAKDEFDHGRLEIKADVLFPFDSSAIGSEGIGIISTIVKKLVNNGKKYSKIVINGYTDNIGSDDYNMRLSERRANAVKDILIRNGVPDKDITTVAKGSSEPIVFCAQKDKQERRKCLSPNRRIVLTIN